MDTLMAPRGPDAVRAGGEFLDRTAQVTRRWDTTVHGSPARVSNGALWREDVRVDVDSRSHLVEIVAAMKEITARITTAETMPEALDDLLKVMGDILPEHLQCGVALVSEGEPAAFASTGLSREVLDEVRGGDGDGPCMEAIRTRDIVVSPDLGSEARWPAWSATAVAAGVHGVLSYPFDVDTLTLGALNLYATRPDAFVDDLPIIAMLVADHASLLLRVQMRQLMHENLLGRVQDVPAGDVTIERAIGIIMAQRGCPPEQALRHLHDAATHLGVGLPVIAERLVRTVSDRGAA
jgi:hypothetical protein